MPNKFFPIGSLSTGTLREQDIADALMPLLQRVYIEKGVDLWHLPKDHMIEKLFAIADGEGDDPEVLDEAMDIIGGSDLMPPFAYLGSHPGDGADIGIWPDFERLADARRSGEVPHITDLTDLDEQNPQVGDIFALVNDHGNVTLLEITAQSHTIWEVV